MERDERKLRWQSLNIANYTVIRSQIRNSQVYVSNALEADDEVVRFQHDMPPESNLRPNANVKLILLNEEKSPPAPLRRGNAFHDKVATDT